MEKFAKWWCQLSHMTVTSNLDQNALVRTLMISETCNVLVYQAVIIVYLEDSHHFCLSESTQGRSSTTTL